jgi:hypothetical protein
MSLPVLINLLTYSIKPYTECFRTGGSYLKHILPSRNGGQKRSQKYSGCNNFLVMNFSN